MSNTDKPQWIYFAADGSCGDARGLVVIDTTNFTDRYWQAVDDAYDNQRQQVAEMAGIDLGSYIIPIDETLAEVEREVTR